MPEIMVILLMSLLTLLAIIGGIMVMPSLAWLALSFQAKDWGECRKSSKALALSLGITLIGVIGLFFGRNLF